MLLVGGLEHEFLYNFFDFPFSWEWNFMIPTDVHSIIFQRGRFFHQVDNGYKWI